jgi:hypothetical protein
MKKELINLFMFLAICFIAYFLLRNFHFKPREGMTDSSGNSIPPPTNGVAGNASSYSASIKAATIKLTDSFLISKYRGDYETVILNLDDYINCQMLQTALSIDQINPGPSLAKLVEMNQTKAALNNIMKFIDKQS